MEETHFRAVRVLSALANPLRFSIALELCDGPRTPTGLARRFKRSLPRISYHLAHLRKADVVRFRSDGQQLVYRLKHESVVTLCKAALEAAQGVHGARS